MAASRMAAKWRMPTGRTAKTLGFVLYGGGERLCVWINGSSETITISMPSPRAAYRWEDAPETVPARSVAFCAGSPRWRGKSDGTPDELIEKLAESAGIQPIWWDIDGHKTEVPLETKRALLTAMGIDYSSAARRLG